MPIYRKFYIRNLHPKLFIDINKIKYILKYLNNDTIYKIPKGELSIIFLDEKSIIFLHKKYLNNNNITDVITFPGDIFFNFAGEICISLDEAYNVSNKLNISFEEEVIRYLIHGWLHLSGFKDNDYKKKLNMDIIQNDILKKLKIIK